MNVLERQSTVSVFELLILMCLVIVGLPVLIYLCVKLGTLAYFQGARLYRETLKEKSDHGEKKDTN